MDRKMTEMSEVLIGTTKCERAETSVIVSIVCSAPYRPQIV